MNQITRFLTASLMVVFLVLPSAAQANYGMYGYGSNNPSSYGGYSPANYGYPTGYGSMGGTHYAQYLSRNSGGNLGYPAFNNFYTLPNNNFNQYPVPMFNLSSAMAPAPYGGINNFNYGTGYGNLFGGYPAGGYPMYGGYNPYTYNASQTSMYSSMYYQPSGAAPSYGTYTSCSITIIEWSHCF